VDLEEGIVTYLRARTGITALVSTRIYDQVVPTPDEGEPDANYPAITYQVISNNSVMSHQGSSGLAFVRVQFNCWGRTKLEVLSIRNALMDALNGFKGLFGTVVVGACLKVDERDMPNEKFASPELRQARVKGKSLDFQIWHNEPKPTFA
jgi:hypothetical protein